MNNGYNKPKQLKCDNYNTCADTYKLIKNFVPTNINIYDPFYNDGSCKKTMEEIFKSNIIHEDKNAFSWFPDNVDMIITNPPFSIKYEVLNWLMDKDIPFACLLPFMTICTLKFSKIKNFDKIQFITASTRIKYLSDTVNGSPCFESAWFCYKMNLPKDMNILNFKDL